MCSKLFYFASPGLELQRHCLSRTDLLSETEGLLFHSSWSAVCSAQDLGFSAKGWPSTWNQHSCTEPGQWTWVKEKNRCAVEILPTDSEHTPLHCLILIELWSTWCIGCFSRTAASLLYHMFTLLLEYCNILSERHPLLLSNLFYVILTTFIHTYCRRRIVHIVEEIIQAS